ncbi:MAG: hypothetical protein RL081_1452 [Pseudomonadota bacterium]
MVNSGLWRTEMPSLRKLRLIVVVRGERLGVGTTGDGVEHGGFHFQKTVLHHELTQTTHGFAAGYKTPACVLIGHQVDVALAVLDFLVIDAVKLVRHGPQALGEQADL